MHVEHLSNSLNLVEFLKKMGVDGGGVSILAQKGSLHLVHIKDLHVGAANILKQDALSVGADLAVPRGTVTASVPRVDALLIANERQLRELAQKEKVQPFGLKILAGELERFCSLKLPQKVEVMGIINANNDSFYPNSCFNVSSSMGAVEEMILQGADIIDIGGVSSRPNSVIVSVEEEFNRLKPIIDMLYEQRMYEKIRFSLDSYTPAVIAYALERGFSMVNDITGLANDTVAQLCGEFKATAVIMHMQGTPQTMQHNPHYKSVLHEMEQFFQERLEKADRFGIVDVILDCGIGFGKRLEDNLELIAHQKHLLSLGKPLLVGASRKSMIDALCPSTTHERLGGTLALHLRAIQEGASMVRVHDIQEHVQAIAVWQALGALR